MLHLTGCDSESIPPEEIVDGTNNGFESFEVAEIFAKSCATDDCHAGNSPKGGLSIKNYSELMNGTTNRSGGNVPDYGGEDIIPFNSAKSFIYQFISHNVTPIAPHDAISLTEEQINTIKLWIDNGAKNFDKQVPFQDPSYRVYVCNQKSDAVSVINGDRKVVSALINLDFLQTVDSPHMVKERDGFLYVTLIATAKLLKIDTRNNQITGEVTGITKAGMIQISPDGTKAYVSRSSTSDPVFNSIFVVNILNMTMIKEILLPAPGVPHGLALSPDGSTLYAANLTLDRISIIDAVNDEYLEDIVLPAGTEPMQAEISPDGKYLYISARGTNMLMVFDTSTKTVLAQVPVAAGPMHIAVTSDGNKIYLPSMMGNVVNIIIKNGTSWTKTGEISHPGFILLHGADLTDDDRYLYVSSRNTNGNFVPQFTVIGEGPPGTIGIIDTQTDKVIKLIEIEEHGAGLTIGR
jgi:YVTN family beta-propeller protein